MKFALLNLSLCFSLCFLTACNLNQKVDVKGVDVYTHQEGGRLRLEIETIFLMGNLHFPNSINPIMNLSKKNKIGEVIVQNLEDGTNRLAVSIDYAEAMNLGDELGKTLPNGREIPNDSGTESPLVGIPVLENSRLYISKAADGNLFTGIALNIPAFDQIFSESSGGNLNLFKTYPLSKEVHGVSGFYSSPQRGLNGFAIFAKKTAVNKPNRNPAQSLLSGIPDELKRLDKITLFRFNQLLNKHAVLRIK